MTHQRPWQTTRRVKLATWAGAALANLLFLSLLHHSQDPRDQTSLRSRKVTMLLIPKREPDAAVSQTAPVLPNRKPRKDNGAVVVLRTTAPSISLKTTGIVPPASTLGVPGTAELQLPPSRQADAEGSPQSLNLNLPQAFLRGDRPTARSEALAHPASNTARLKSRRARRFGFGRHRMHLPGAVTKRLDRAPSRPARGSGAGDHGLRRGDEQDLQAVHQTMTAPQSRPQAISAQAGSGGPLVLGSAPVKVDS